MAYLRLPDNSFFTIPEGASPQEAYALARQKYPEAFEAPKPKDTGFTGALKASTQELKGDVAALLGRTGLMDEAAAEEYRAAQKKKAQDIFAPTEEGWADAPFLKARELLGGSLPYVAAPVAAAGAVAAAPLTGTAATAAGLGAGLTAGALQYTATNLGRQLDTEEGKALKDTDLLAAGAAAIPQAALDTLSLRLIPGIGRIFGAAGKKITPEMAKEIAQQGITKTAGAYALQGVKTAGIEGTTEVAQQFLERLQAGLNIADPEARDEYFESFIGGAVLGGTLSVPGKFMERGGAKQFARAEEQRLQDEAAIAAEEQKKTELEAKDVAALIAAQQGTLGKPERPAEGVVGKTADIFGEKIKAEETKQVKAEREAAEAEAAAVAPAEVLERNRLLSTQLSELERRRDAAAEAGKTTEFAALVKQTDELEKLVAESAEALTKTPGIIFVGPRNNKKAVAVTPDIEMAELRGSLRNLTKELSKQVGPGYDAKTARSLAGRIEATEKKINDLAPAAGQFEMFDEAQMGAEKRVAERGEREMRAQEQQDLFAQQREVLDETGIKRYQESLQELEDAYAEGKSERIIDELITKLQAIGQEKEAGKVGIKGGAEQEESIERINRIKRAIKAEEAKLESATTNEEVATIRADIAALNSRLGIALTESATAQPENARAKAEADAQEAVDTFSFAINDIRSGDYLNGRDVTTAASFRSGLEKQAYDAASAYIEASIRDVNAQRAQANQTALSTDEALKLTNDLSSFFKKAVDSKQPNVRKSLDQIKNKYTKGAPKRRAGEKPEKAFALEQETLPASLRAKAAKEKLEELPKDFSKKDAANLAKLEKERAALDAEKPSMAIAKRVKELDAQIKELRERAGRYLTVFGEADRAEKAKELNDAYKEAAAKIEEEAEAGRKAEAESQAEKAKQEEVDYERYAPTGISPDQKNLFEDTDLAPLAITRATPQNFMKFLGSAQVMKARAKLKELAAKVKKTEELSKKTPQVDTDLARQVEEQRRFVLEVQNADKLVAELRKKATTIWKEAAGDPARLKTIDDLHAQANELMTADLKFEKAILASMERTLAKVPKASPAALKLEKDLARARSQNAAHEATQQKMLEDQAVARRLAEQKALEETQALPKTRQEVVETNRALPGKDEKLKAKQLTKVPPAKTTAEKSAEVIAKEKELAEERKQFLQQTYKGMTPQQLEKVIKEFEAQAKVSREKGNEAAAKRQEKTAEKLKKDLKSRMDVARMAMRGRAEGKTARPPAMKTGVKAETRGRKAKVEFDQDALDHGVAYDDYMEVQRGLAFGFKARVEAAKTGAGITQKDANAVIAKVKLPKGLKIVVVNRLQGNLRDAVVAQGMNPDNVRGGVMPNGSVFIVAENHTDVKDLQRTLAHEITGHLGIENLLGESGMNALIKKITSQYGSVFKLADQLGVGQDALAAFNAAKRIGKTDQQALASAVREMIAHTEEARPDKNFLAKAGEFIKAMVGAVRAALRKIGIDLDISTSDIFKLLRDARKDFDATAPGAYVNKDGDILFSSKPSTATGEFANVLRTAGKIVAEQKPWHDRLFGELTGLVFQTKYLDRFAPVQKLLDKTRESLKATQLMYFLRMHDQRMAWTSEIASHGAAVLRAAKDGKGLIIESQDGANLKQVAEALRGAKVGTPEDTNRMFTLYLLAKRAKRVGVEKLNFSGKVTESMLKDAIRAVENNKPTFDAFEKAAGIYNEYNKGLVNFAIQTGAISKEVGRKMLASEDYVPFYREDPKTGNVLLEIGGADPIKIGNVTDQPYLHELIGGDEAVLDFFTSSLQNTAMMTDMALRNLAARNVAFTLGEMGLLKVGEKEKGIGIRPGDGPANKRGAHRTIRFKVDGEEKHVIVDTDAAGVDSELLVRGLEGVNTALPNAVKLMNIPANLLRKWVTRNPAYTLRQVIRDPMNAVMVSGVNTIPVISSLKEISKVIPKILKGEEVQSELRSKGILGGQVLTGTAEDQKQILTQITSGKAGWDSVWAKADQLAIQGDAATRVVMYNNFIKQGLSEMEATLATLEAMNFSKRGISPSLFALSTMVPFMNAQIQGLNVLYNAFAGKMPFNDKLKVKQKLFQRLSFMFGMSMLYAALMQDDEAYKNANDDEKYNNWFVYVPGVDEPVKVPIPFELGLIGKAFPEAIVNTAFGDEKARDTVSALAKMVWNAIPISGPQGVKPLLEVAINHSFYTGREIESDRLQRFEPGERYNDRTTELVKAIGQATNISPVKIEYLIRGYTGSVPLALGSLANPVLRSGEGGEKPEGRASELPLFGSFFQPTDAQGLVNKAYKDVEEINKMKETYKKMEEEGRVKEADAYLDANADVIALASLAGKFRKQMGELTKQEREIKADPTMTPEEKRKALDEIRQDKIQLAKELSSERG